MRDTNRRLTHLETVWQQRQSLAPPTRFDPARLSPAELADVARLAPLVERDPTGRVTFHRLDDDQFHRLGSLMMQGCGRQDEWTPRSQRWDAPERT